MKDPTNKHCISSIYTYTYKFEYIHRPILLYTIILSMCMYNNMLLSTRCLIYLKIYYLHEDSPFVCLKHMLDAMFSGVHSKGFEIRGAWSKHQRLRGILERSGPAAVFNWHSQLTITSNIYIYTHDRIIMIQLQTYPACQMPMKPFISLRTFNF